MYYTCQKAQAVFCGSKLRTLEQAAGNSFNLPEGSLSTKCDYDFGSTPRPVIPAVFYNCSLHAHD